MAYFRVAYYGLPDVNRSFVDGMLGISNVYADILGTPGILQSPILDLSNGGGKIMLEMSVIGIDVSSMTVQLVNALTDELIDSSFIQYNYISTSGSLSHWVKSPKCLTSTQRPRRHLPTCR